MTYTDKQLERALAKMLPDEVQISNSGAIYWRDKPHRNIRHTELLALCAMVEDSLNEKDKLNYSQHLVLMFDKGVGFFFKYLHATWQQRTIALAKVKGIAL